MSEITEAYEYSVSLKPDAKLKLKKFLLVVLYVILPILAILIMSIWKGLLPLGCFIVLADAVVYFFTWRYVNLDMSYELKSGVVTFAIFRNVMNHRYKKEIMKFALKDCTLIAPLSESKEKIDEFKPEKTYEGRGSVNSEDSYVVLFTDSDGKHIAFNFEATAEMLKRCRFYNREATVVKETRI